MLKARLDKMEKEADTGLPINFDLAGALARARTGQPATPKERRAATLYTPRAMLRERLAAARRRQAAALREHVLEAGPDRTGDSADNQRGPDRGHVLERPHDGA